jgi:hypothetical protein
MFYINSITRFTFWKTHASKQEKDRWQIILWVEAWIEKLIESYSGLLKWSLGHKRWVADYNDRFY